MIPHAAGIASAAVFGAVVGSFLNACIYRMPRGISLRSPARSFCPHCRHPIPWHHNIPVLSYIALRGKCGFCGGAISPRYPAVELLVACLFAALYHLHGLPAALAYATLAALLVAATFIDIDFLIIPDEITLGGTAAGLAFSAALPQLMGQTSHLPALGWSAAGAACGFFLLWGVVEAGKLAFGKKKHAFDGPTAFVWRRDGETAEFDFGGEKLGWEDIFSRASDELVLECEKVSLPGREISGAVLRFRFDSLRLPEGEIIPLDSLDEFAGTATRMVVPREAMGFGDVKFLAAIGAFLGWPAVLFTVFVASVAGCMAGVVGMIFGKAGAGTQVPFGPFLATGALAWMLGGSSVWFWYFATFAPHLFFR